MLARTLILTFLVTVLAASGWHHTRAQTADAFNCDGLDDEQRAQCLENKKVLEESRSVRPVEAPQRTGTPVANVPRGAPSADPQPAGTPVANTPPPTPPDPQPARTPVANAPPPPSGLGPDVEAMVERACGVVLKPDPTTPDARPVIVISADKRGPIDAALGTPPAADVEAVSVNGCFAKMGGSGYVVVTPPGDPEQYLVTGGDRKSDLSKWLTAPPAPGTRVRLAPRAECAEVLANLPSGAPEAAWVEDGRGPSRCERSAAGGVRVDPNKVQDYGGTIVLKVDRG
jgi:hypothetical protein